MNADKSYGFELPLNCVARRKFLSMGSCTIDNTPKRRWSISSKADGAYPKERHLRGSVRPRHHPVRDNCACVERADTRRRTQANAFATVGDLGVLPLCFRLKPIPRHQSIRTLCVDGPPRFFQRRHHARLLRRPTGISGWARNSACYGSMACEPPHGSRQAGSISPPAIFEVCSPRATGVFGLAPMKGLASWKDGN